MCDIEHTNTFVMPTREWRNNTPAILTREQRKNTHHNPPVVCRGCHLERVYLSTTIPPVIKPAGKQFDLIVNAELSKRMPMGLQTWALGIVMDYLGHSNMHHLVMRNIALRHGTVAGMYMDVAKMYGVVCSRDDTKKKDINNITCMYHSYVATMPTPECHRIYMFM